MGQLEYLLHAAGHAVGSFPELEGHYGEVEFTRVVIFGGETEVVGYLDKGDPAGGQER